MLLFVGLGNPGANYAGNRHNVGFMALDRIAEDHKFTPWRPKFQGLVCEGTLGTDKVLMLKPQTFMNVSGQSVGEALRFHKLTPAEMMVFHDELDLAPGKIKVKEGGGHAGHNGLRSLHDHIGDAYGRVRIGIGHPGHKDQVAHFVLQDFAKADANWLAEIMTGISEGAPALAACDTAQFLNIIGMRMNPQKPKAASAPKPGQKAAKPAVSQPAPKPKPEPMPEEPKSALQRLIDKFR